MDADAAIAAARARVAELQRQIAQEEQQLELARERVELLSADLEWHRTANGFKHDELETRRQHLRSLAGQQR